MREVERTFGDLKEILHRARPELKSYDKLFYQALVAKDPVYGFLKLLASVGAGGVTLSRRELHRLLIEFVKAWNRLARYAPRGMPIKDVRFRLVELPHKYASDYEDLRDIVSSVKRERAARERIAQYLKALDIYGSFKRGEL